MYVVLYAEVNVKLEILLTYLRDVFKRTKTVLEFLEEHFRLFIVLASVIAVLEFHNRDFFTF